ncbi:hypothetical protein BYT27DRAFT_6653478 [Phlegmacium glaucopus]|nr:hypothetical protein BYT27DRAFT_6653478 [Phlegmacium glaucopus]
MKGIFKKFIKYKKPTSLTINPEPSTSTSTIITGTTGPIPSVPARGAAPSAQVTRVVGATNADDPPVSTSVSDLALNDVASVSVPDTGVNTSHELQVSHSVSALAVTPVAHPERNSLSSPDAIRHASLRSTESEQNPSAQQSGLGLFANAQNTLITGGTFVSLSRKSYV